MMELLIPAAVFVMLAMTMAFFGLARGGDDERVGDRLRELGIGESQSLARRTRRKRGLADLMLARLNFMQKLEEQIWQAGIYMSITEIALIILLIFGAAATVTMIVTGDPAISILLAAGFATLPLFYIRLRQKRRLKAFVQRLPETLDLLKSSLEAGHTLQRALQLIVEEFPEPTAGEIRLVLEQVRLGVPLPRALEDLLRRVPEDSLHMLVVAVRIQHEVGSSLAEIIGRLAQTLRVRARVHAQMRALTAQSRMSGWIVGLLPLVVIAAFSLVQPGYSNHLFGTATGLKMVKAAILLDATAFFTIRRMLRFEY